jgi:hypothetical protein
LLLGFTLSIAAAGVKAEVSTDQPGAILIFPKVASDETQDTIIQVSNAAGAQVFARCFYINGAQGENGQPLWSVRDFQIGLTRQQPAVWVASEGLPSQPPDRPKELYPGTIPPVDAGFIGELRCIVVDDNETPTSRNVLTGEATVIDRAPPHATRKYQGITIPGLPGNNGDTTLLLNDVEYSTCPRVLLLNHFFDGAPDPVLNTPIASTLSFVPCSMDLEHSVPGTATVQFSVINEFEQAFSTSLPVTCFADVTLSGINHTIFDFALQGTLVGQTRIRSVVDADSTHGHGILAIAEEFRDGRQTGAALNLHFIGGGLQSDVIVLPSNF